MSHCLGSPRCLGSQRWHDYCDSRGWRDWPVTLATLATRVTRVMHATPAMRGRCGWWHWQRCRCCRHCLAVSAAPCTATWACHGQASATLTRPASRRRSWSRVTRTGRQVARRGGLACGCAVSPSTATVGVGCASCCAIEVARPATPAVTTGPPAAARHPAAGARRGHGRGRPPGSGTTRARQAAPRDVCQARTSDSGNRRAGHATHDERTPRAEGSPGRTCPRPCGCTHLVHHRQVRLRGLQHLA